MGATGGAGRAGAALASLAVVVLAGSQGHRPEKRNYLDSASGRESRPIGRRICDAAECTLREAIEASNGQTGTDLITFASLVPGPFLIHLTYDLPTITDPVVIDGATQPGYSGTPLIEIDGSAVGMWQRLDIVAGGRHHRALSVGGFGFGGIGMSGAGGNVIVGNYLGVDVTGANPRANGFSGIFVQDSANNQIGGVGQPTATSSPGTASPVSCWQDMTRTTTKYRATTSARTRPGPRRSATDPASRFQWRVERADRRRCGWQWQRHRCERRRRGHVRWFVLQHNPRELHRHERRGRFGPGNGSNGIFVNFGSATPSAVPRRARGRDLWQRCQRHLHHL